MAQYGELLSSGARVQYQTGVSAQNGIITTYDPTTQTSAPVKKPTENILSQYGEEFGVVNLQLDEMYAHFDDYFNHPTMVKIKDVDSYSVYMSKTYCLLSNECRYIVVFIHTDSMPTRTQEPLANLRWVSLQTRTLEDKHDLPPHNYKPRRTTPLNTPIIRTKVDKQCSTYKCEKYPLTVTLLHGKHGADEYQVRGSIISALETYNTILTLTE